MMAQKIKSNKAWPFFQAYHDNNYINSHDCRPIVSLHDKEHPQIKYILNNKNAKEIVVYQIDDRLIHSKETNKCDFAIYTEDDILFFIELKGDDLNQAAKQIRRTIEILLAPKKIKPKMLCPRIVLSKRRTPDVMPSEEKKLVQLLHNNYRGCNDYRKQTQVFKETLQ